MLVTCPHCNTRHVLPESLVGPGGARVRCPRCRDVFAVGPDGAPIETLGAPEPPIPPAAEPPPMAAPAPAPEAEEPAGEPVGAPPAAAAGEPVSEAERVARAVLDDLAAHSGAAIAASQSEGRLFREFGPVIAEAFEFYRRRVGPGADPGPFRAALRERWGIDLEPGRPPRHAR